MNPNDYAFIQKFIREKPGIVLAEGKEYLVESRLRPISREHGYEDLSALVLGMSTNLSTELSKTVVEALVTNESFFFRDKTPFDNFNDVIMPSLLEARAGLKKIRIWCAAASTGQEPYSIAMCIDQMSDKTAGWRFDITGTDISNQVLEKARQGIYSQFEVQRGLAAQNLIKYFSQSGENWQIAANLRSMVDYKLLNLMENFNHLGKFDIVFCRNVLIYFDEPGKVDILSRIASIMPNDGYLVLGAAETVVGISDRFKPVSSKRGLYQLQSTATAAPALGLASAAGAA